MKPYRLLIIILLALAFSSISYAGTPFGGEKEKKTTERLNRKAPNQIYFKLAVMQQKLRSELSEKMRLVKATGSILPMLPLIFIAFAYGVLHAAGPGHGKSLAASYLVSRGRTARDGIYIGGLIAVLHGISAISLVLFLKIILRKSVMAPLEEITYITKIISYSLILFIGTALTIKNLYGWYQNIGVRRDIYSGKFDKRPAGSLATAIAVGMIPCPGTVIIMLFALSINMTGTGILLASAQTLGMALTVSLVGLLVVTGKSRTISFLDYKRRNIADTIEKSIETIAGMMIILIGGFFLLQTIG